MRGSSFFLVTDASFLVINWAEDDTRFQREQKVSALMELHVGQADYFLLSEPLPC
jgi:hypothetical protein